MVFWSCLLSLFLWLRASPANAEDWFMEVPESVMGLSGSCVEIPCKFNYPGETTTNTQFTGIWFKENEESTIYNTDASKIMDSFKGRTSLIGDLRKNDCSLKISSLSSSDTGKFIFRIEIENLNMYSYKKEKEIVSLTVTETPKNPTVVVEDEVASGKPVTATCTVSHSCLSDLPRVTWNHDGTHSSPSSPSLQQNQGQWKLTSYSLTFTPSREDHNKNLSCSAEFNGKTAKGYKTLKVKYPPYNVNTVAESSVKENDSVELTCSSNSNPPAHSYKWFTVNGRMLAKSLTYKLERVSRHTEAISCTAINTEGENSSGPHKLNILYPPEIKSESSCQSTILMVCVCIVDSNPPSEVKWFGPDSSETFFSTSIKQNMSVTTFTLQGWLGFTKTVQCFASNSLGSSSITLEAPLHGLTIYIAVSSAVVVVLVAILVYVVRRRCLFGMKVTQRAVMKNEENEMKTTTNNKEDNTNHPNSRFHGNWMHDRRPFLSDSATEDQPVYSNL